MYPTYIVYFDLGMVKLFLEVTVQGLGKTLEPSRVVIEWDRPSVSNFDTLNLTLTPKEVQIVIKERQIERKTERQMIKDRNTEESQNSN